MRGAGPILGILALALSARASLAELTVTHGAAVGEVTTDSAVVWARANREARMVMTYEAEGLEPRRVTAEGSEARDFTARVKLDGLRPETLYRYHVHFETPAETSGTVDGSFRTAPPPDRAVPLRFVVAGDLGGHGWCREFSSGYEVFDRMAELDPMFFVANGDMIYADTACPPERPDGGRNVPGDFTSVDAPDLDWTDEAVVREIYLAHWRYNRADEHFQRFLLQVPLYVQWDDHEVINDFGAPWSTWKAAGGRKGFPVLVRAGRTALFDFHPLWPNPAEPHRIYRSFRWGAEAELFLLDARSYRSENDLPDTPASGKTLLGAEQLAWLERGLESSTATWKIVSSDVPLSIPTGTDAEVLGRDAFANGSAPDAASRTGAETELGRLLRHLDRKHVRNVVFVVTDVHFAANLRYELDLDGDGEPLLFYELVSGPLSAGLAEPRPPDPTFAPKVLFMEGGFFNFSFIRLTGDRLAAEIRDDQGRVRPGSPLEVTATK